VRVVFASKGRQYLFERMTPGIAYNISDKQYFHYFPPRMRFFQSTFNPDEADLPDNNGKVAECQPLFRIARLGVIWHTLLPAFRG
jgi:hypothetical protein